MSDTITTIIPTYKRPHLLKKTIESVLNQTYPHFEIIICDNNSNDETGPMVKTMLEKDSRIKYFCHTENIGPWENFAFGLKQVKTKYFCFLSDDDLFLPWFFEDSLNIFKKYPEAGLSAMGVLHFFHGKFFRHTLSEWGDQEFFPSQEAMHKIVNILDLIWTGVLFKTEILDRIGYLDTEVGALFDLDFLLRVVAKYPIAINKKPATVYYTHSFSLSYQLSSKVYWPGCKKMLQNFAANNLIEFEKKLERKIKRLFFALALRLLFIKQFHEIKKIYKIINCELNKEFTLYDFFFKILKFGNNHFLIPLFSYLIKFIQEQNLIWRVILN